jgi:hypothetical protein
MQFHPGKTLASDEQSTHILWFAAVLLVGLVGIVPAFTLLVRWNDIPIPRPALLGVAGVCGLYALFVLYSRQLIAGSAVGLLVLGTFAANVPLTNAYYPAGIGPAVWLFYFPLIPLLVWVARSEWIEKTMTRTHFFFIALVSWSLLAAFFGAGPQLDVALAFAGYLTILCVVFTVMVAITYQELLDLRMVVLVLAGTAVAHATYAVAQLIHGRSFDISTLGEAARYSSTTITVGPFTAHIGVFLTGFTGGASQLINLILLTATPLLCFAFLGDARRRWRVLAAGISAALFILVRLTVKDAARGAVLLTLMVVTLLVVWFHREHIAATLLRAERTTRSRVSHTASRLGAVIGLCIGGLAQFYPTSDIGQGVVVKSSSTNTTATSDSVTAATDTALGMAHGPYQPSQLMVTVLTRIEGLHVPLVNMSTLGVRLRQYLAVLDVSLLHPVFGLGGGNFGYIALAYGLRSARRTTVTVGNAIHNMYLVILAGTGWPGLLLFLALCVSIAAVCQQLIVQPPDGLPRWVPVGVACGLFGYAAYMFWNVTFLTPAGVVPAVALGGALVGSYVRQQRHWA